METSAKEAGLKDRGIIGPCYPLQEGGDESAQHHLQLPKRNPRRSHENPQLSGEENASQLLYLSVVFIACRRGFNLDGSCYHDQFRGWSDPMLTWEFISYQKKEPLENWEDSGSLAPSGSFRNPRRFEPGTVRKASKDGKKKARPSFGEKQNLKPKKKGKRNTPIRSQTFLVETNKKGVPLKTKKASSKLSTPTLRPCHCFCCSNLVWPAVWFVRKLS